jgi:hypothetical protein
VLSAALKYCSRDRLSEIDFRSVLVQFVQPLQQALRGPDVNFRPAANGVGEPGFTDGRYQR